jgi:hypothetical protein
MATGEILNILEYDMKYDQWWAVTKVISQKQIFLLSYKSIPSTPHIPKPHFSPLPLKTCFRYRITIICVLCQTFFSLWSHMFSMNSSVNSNNIYTMQELVLNFL